MNCAASVYSSGTGQCSLLIVMERQLGEVGGICPLGRQNFSFIGILIWGVNTLPGPCGFWIVINSGGGGEHAVETQGRSGWW